MICAAARASHKVDFYRATANPSHDMGRDIENQVENEESFNDRATANPSHDRRGEVAMLLDNSKFLPPDRRQRRCEHAIAELPKIFQVQAVKQCREMTRQNSDNIPDPRLLTAPFKAIQNKQYCLNDPSPSPRTTPEKHTPESMWEDTKGTSNKVGTQTFLRRKIIS